MKPGLVKKIAMHANKSTEVYVEDIRAVLHALDDLGYVVAKAPIACSVLMPANAVRSRQSHGRER